MYKVCYFFVEVKTTRIKTTQSNQKKIIILKKQKAKENANVKKTQSSILAQFHTKQKCSKNTCAIEEIFFFEIFAYERKFVLYVCMCIQIIIIKKKHLLLLRVREKKKITYLLFSKKKNKE